MWVIFLEIGVVLVLLLILVLATRPKRSVQVQRSDREAVTAPADGATPNSPQQPDLDRPKSPAPVKNDTNE